MLGKSLTAKSRQGEPSHQVAAGIYQEFCAAFGDRDST